MVTLDAWQEVFLSMRKNKLRSALTALSVAWGIFMLVLLLAAGTGLRQGVSDDFKDEATNSIYVGPGKTSLPYDGLGPGRKVRFDNADVETIRRSVPGVEYLTARYYLWNGMPVSYQSKSGSFELRGCHPDHQYFERTILTSGRFINAIDEARRRKVAVIGPDVQQTLFGKEDPLGKIINVRGASYEVIGVYQDEGGPGELRKIYIPISTAQLVYHGGDTVHGIMYTIGASTVEQSEKMADLTRSLLARRHNFSLEDRNAIHVNNNLVQFKKLMDIFDWMEVFVWVVGLGTLFAGVVGVSNIMLISVQERTLEIGIRKAVGATPASVIGMVLAEALFITACAGYVGLIAGVGLVEVVARNLPANDFVRQPSVDVRVAVVATLILIVAGGLAGLVPAWRAARVKPVVAMRRA
jgi:putative ABC transport system permease protein